MRAQYNPEIIKVNVYSIIIFFITFFSSTLLAHPHQHNELSLHQHTHPKDENDLNIQSSNLASQTNSNQNQTNKKLILVDDNLYLLDDDFDFGNDEFDLHKIEINTDDLEIANEYEEFLNSLYKEANFIGSKTSSSKTYNNENFVRLNGRINNLESEKHHLEYEKLNLKQKIETLEMQLQSTAEDKGRKVDHFESERRLLNQKIQTLEMQLQSGISNKTYNDLKTSYNNLKAEFDSLAILSEKSTNKAKLPEKSYKKTIHSPRKSGFGISTFLGSTIPIFQEDFSVGPNIGIHLETPFLFNLVGTKTKVGTEFYYSIMFPSTINNNKNWYSLYNFIVNLSISPSLTSSMEIRSGLGLTLAKIGEQQKTALSIPFDLIYYLPMDLSGFKIGINLLSQVTMGHPVLNKTASHINIGLVIKTPINF